MPDFPNVIVRNQSSLISTFGNNTTVGINSMSQNLNATAGVAWPANNRALYVYFWINHRCTARKIGVPVTTSSGNLDVGIYDSVGARIVSKGTTAVAAASTQIIDLTASVTGTASPVLNPGGYFLAMVCSTTAAAFKAGTLTTADMCRISGVQQEALGSTVLPATAAFANPASAYVPVVVMQTSTVL